MATPSAASEVLDRWRAEGRLVPFCPETAAGLAVPRAPAEIIGGDGAAVLKGVAYVGDSTRGRRDRRLPAARRRAALDVARAAGARVAVLKDGSPSCATTYVHDGTFRDQRDRGQGVTATLLAQAGLRLFNEHQLEAAAACVAELEAESSPR